MRFIPTRIHGFLDYGMGLLLIVAPWLFGFADGGAETWIPVILGIGAIGYSLLTDYELGVARTIPMATHLMLDIASGIVLAVSPWIFGFAGDVWAPHLILGLLEIGAGLTTRTTPDTSRVNSRGAV
ncbi:MAG: SPW repeat protein [Chloroflexota bacterium]|nr:SPW repeat protein [Chloroflexota bacterium]